MIVTHELRISAVKTVMMLLRACGPCYMESMKHELLIQCVGVTKANVEEVWKKAFQMMTHKRFPMIEVYYEDEDGTSWHVASRMYDSAGNYKGEE